MRTIEESNQRAKEMCAGGYRYLYGAKGQAYTRGLVNQLHSMYPSCVPEAEALKDADKGYRAIDCSGFVCDALGVSMAGSSQLRSAAVKRLAVTKANAREGMAIWRNGHIAYIGEGLKIYEAASTKTDMRVSSFENRAGAFIELLVVKGSALEAELAHQDTAIEKAVNPYSEPSKTVTSTAQAKLKGCKVFVSTGGDVKWLQWELREAGYDIEIDGKMGPKTIAVLIAFQQSCKIVMDGLAGSATRQCLKAN